MPGLNFNYTKFLREQNEKYVKKYGEEAIKADPNPQPIVGFSGHVPSYRGSLHELRVVRSLVRCINSPMKPTTATGYRSKSRQFYNPEDDDHLQPPPSASKSNAVKNQNGKASPKDQKESSATQDSSVKVPDRVRSAPAALSREKEMVGDVGPRPSHISMMAAGSSAILKGSRPQTAISGPRSHEPPKSPQSKDPFHRTSSRTSSRSSVTPLRLPTPPVIPKHPAGYPQTLYGSSYWYAWPGETPRSKESSRGKRPDSYSRDRRLTRHDGVLYHRHEGMVPKYLGYVPGYKFRHGSTFGVLTVNATTHGLAHKLIAKS